MPTAVDQDHAEKMKAKKSQPCGLCTIKPVCRYQHRQSGQEIKTDGVKDVGGLKTADRTRQQLNHPWPKHTALINLPMRRPRHYTLRCSNRIPVSTPDDGGDHAKLGERPQQGCQNPGDPMDLDNLQKRPPILFFSRGGRFTVVHPDGRQCPYKLRHAICLGMAVQYPIGCGSGVPLVAGEFLMRGVGQTSWVSASSPFL